MYLMFYLQASSPVADIPWLRRIQDVHNFHLPQHVENILSLFGYDNAVSFKALEDIKKLEQLEQEVREDIVDILPAGESLSKYRGRFKDDESFQSRFKFFGSEREGIAFLVSAVKLQTALTSKTTNAHKAGSAVKYKSAFSRVGNPGTSSTNNLDSNVRNENATLLDLVAEEGYLLESLQKSLPSKWNLKATKDSMQPRVFLKDSGSLGAKVMCPFCDKYYSLSSTPYKRWCFSNYIRHITEVHKKEDGEARRRSSEGSRSTKKNNLLDNYFRSTSNTTDEQIAGPSSVDEPIPGPSRAQSCAGRSSSVSSRRVPVRLTKIGRRSRTALALSDSDSSDFDNPKPVESQNFVEPGDLIEGAAEPSGVPK